VGRHSRELVIVVNRLGSPTTNLWVAPAKRGLRICQFNLQKDRLSNLLRESPRRQDSKLVFPREPEHYANQKQCQSLNGVVKRFAECEKPVLARGCLRVCRHRFGTRTIRLALPLEFCTSYRSLAV
jgi:hypothetical protein